MPALFPRTKSCVINDEIQAYMDVLADIPGQQQKCIEMAWGMMAIDCESDIRDWFWYHKQNAPVRASIRSFVRHPTNCILPADAPERRR